MYLWCATKLLVKAHAQLFILVLILYILQSYSSYLLLKQSLIILFCYMTIVAYSLHPKISVARKPYSPHMHDDDTYFGRVYAFLKKTGKKKRNTTSPQLIVILLDKYHRLNPYRRSIAAQGFSSIPSFVSLKQNFSPDLILSLELGGSVFGGICHVNTSVWVDCPGWVVRLLPAPPWRRWLMAVSVKHNLARNNIGDKNLKQLRYRHTHVYG
jgi:hypothetical protein